MKDKVVMSGQLHPGDGIEGCTFTVVDMGSGQFKITLTSPYEHKSIVEEDTVEESKVGEWLLGRVDY